MNPDQQILAGVVIFFTLVVIGVIIGVRKLNEDIRKTELGRSDAQQIRQQVEILSDFELFSKIEEYRNDFPNHRQQRAEDPQR